MKLSCFQEGDDGQEDLVKVEKKEVLGEEVNPEWWQSTGLSTTPNKPTTGPVTARYKEEKRRELSLSTSHIDCRQLTHLSTDLRRLLTVRS